MRSVKATKRLIGRRYVASVLSVLLVGFQFIPLVQPQAASAQGVAPGAPVAPTRTREASSGVVSNPAASGMTVGAGVTRLINVSNTPVLDLVGNLNNQGTIYVFSANSQVRNSTITAQNIFNGPNALITTVIPSGGLAAFTGSSHHVTDLSLTLVALNNIINNGTISSANNLTVLAGGNITNFTPLTSVANPATMQAANNLNILASTIGNNGLLSSIAGNVNIANPSMYAATAANVQQLLGYSLPGALQPHINFNNAGGTIEALQGAINIGGPELAKNSDLSMLGGNLTAPQINFNGGDGSVQVNVENASGTVNVSACSAQVGSQSGLLNLGNLNLAGDPTFFNFGDILLTGDISVGENLAILATGNITSLAPRLISTTDGLGAGHTVWMVAGAKLSAFGLPIPTGSPTLPGGTALIPGQFVSVLGASPTGGTISLAGSTIDTRSTTGNNAGGNVNLIAYGGLNTGGITGVNIQSGGFGTGLSGAVKLVAGGTNGLVPNQAISAVNITIAGGAKAFNPGAGVFAAQPIGTATFNSAGMAFGAISAGTSTPRDISVGIINIDGGDLTVKTGGAFTNTGAIVTSGIAPGRDAGDISITAKTIDIQGNLSAVGANGSAGANGLLPGAFGSAGANGGGGGMVKFDATTSININADINTRGGAGGNGGNGLAGGAQQGGGAGGGGGNGGGAGQIQLNTMNGLITQSLLSTISAGGANAGNGGTAGAGGPGNIGMAGSGGRGGNAGAASGGGVLLGKSGAGAMLLNGTLDLSGGSGGSGGAGGAGGSDLTKTFLGGLGGNTGASSGGGGGGTINLQTTDGALTLGSASVAGGQGGITAASGVGGTGFVGGGGGIVAAGGGGGGGGSITLLSTNGKVTLATIADVKGGNGGAQLSGSGAGGDGNVAGGAGGLVLGAGGGASGGRFYLSTKGDVDINGSIDARGGTGGDIFLLTAGAGGVGLNGGSGGAVGSAGGGGLGGSASISGAAIAVTNAIDASGGFGGSNSATGGTGTAATSILLGANGAGGDGGGIGSSGGGGGGGGISITSTAGVTVAHDLLARGGNGGTVSGTAGNGGNSLGVGRAGVGGGLFAAGSGAGGGKITIMAERNVNIVNVNIIGRSISASGGAGGSETGTAGNGGDANVGGAGGKTVGTGLGGGAGMITVKTSQTTGDLVIDKTVFTASGGAAGIYPAKSGNGGKGRQGEGGAGGSAGNQSSAGGGGMISLEAKSLRFSDTSQLLANGGSTFGFNPTSGTGGDGGVLNNTGNGGFGGSVGNAGSGGGGGLIGLKMPGAILVDGPGFPDSIAARGGSVLDNDAQSGAGGKSGLTSGNGGNGGAVGNNGSAGDGGTVRIAGTSGAISNTIAKPPAIVVAGGQVFRMSATSGAGGDAGGIGNGGSSGSIGNNGDAGDGGSIYVSSFNGQISLSPLIAPGGDVNGIFNPVTGKGGNGGSVIGNGGGSGFIGNNGRGGNGGYISITSVFGDLSPKGSTPDAQGNSVTFLAPAGIVGLAAATTGDGGSATWGNGGSSGFIGNNGRAGDGGKIEIQSLFGNIVTPKGSIVVTGADGGTVANATGLGGNTLKGVGGSSGNIGNNSDGGTSGSLLISTLGDITISGPLILRGGFAGGNTNKTGNGGNSANGNGGASGMIGRGGNGGDAGRVDLWAGGSMLGEEAIIADGGNAVSRDYQPQTGNGGNGSSFGGNSGNIGDAGTSGKGGLIFITAVFGDINSDRLFANGGFAGDVLVVTPPLPHPAYPGITLATTGNGGNGGINGGSAGRVGNGAKGGAGGMITLSAGRAIPTSVDYRANGGNGGAQGGTGGTGGIGLFGAGGTGGSVGNAGDGGWAGTISLTASTGITIKELQGIGGNGGANSGLAGNGGGGTTGGGWGGTLGHSGDGGLGGTLVVKVATSGDLDIVGNAGTNLFGGSGGDLTGKGGNGGNGGAGGVGGATDVAGGGGTGGAIKINVPGVVTLMQNMSVRGGLSGSQSGTGGNGGNGTNLNVGGVGGDVGGQKDAGSGGLVLMSVGSLLLLGGPVLTASGGTASIAQGVSGTGGIGGGPGGDAGNAFAAGSGGNGGTIKILSVYGVTVNGGIRANGGDRGLILTKTGNGGNAGAMSGIGGDGGNIAISGGGGKGGGIEITSLFDSVIGAGSISAIGGGAPGVLAGSMQSGNGGNGTGNGNGGLGGTIGFGPGGGDAGSIKIGAYGNITVQAFEAYGGDVGGAYEAKSGNGGNGGASRGTGGTGGRVGNAGGGGDGGGITLQSFVGTISPMTIMAYGGNASDMNATSGNGGNQTVGTGDGGVGGDTGDNGGGGVGGMIKVTTLGLVTSTGDWNVNGGSVGAYGGQTGNGGIGGPVSGLGGEAGTGGNNGAGGKGGSISIGGADGAVTMTGQLLANGGSVLGNQTATGGIGGNGGGGGGGGGGVGNAGRAGGGGKIDVKTKAGDINVSLLSANAGGVANQLGQGGKGGNGTANSVDNHGGGGGMVGAGTDGAGGGMITVSTGAGNINLNSTVLALGGAGGNNNGIGGNAGSSTKKGGDGGAVDVAGSAALGGSIGISSTFGTITTTGILSAAGANGGIQNGKAGTAANGPQVGGIGGDVRKAGDGGSGGKVSILNFFGNSFINNNLNASAGDGAVNTGVATPGGVGTSNTGGLGGSVGGAGSGGRGGSVEVTNIFGTLSVAPLVVFSADGGLAQNQTGVAGDGGASTTGAGGKGGSVGGPGSGGSGGGVTVYAPSTPSALLVITATALGRAAGMQMGTIGVGGAGTPIGVDGKFGPAGRPGTNGMVTITTGAWADDADSEIEEGDLAKRKQRRQIALRRMPSEVSYAQGGLRGVSAVKSASDNGSGSDKLRYADFIESADMQDDSALSVSLVQPSAPHSVANIPTAALSELGISASAAVIAEAVCNDELSSRMAALGATLTNGGSNASFKLTHGDVLFAPTSQQITVTVPQGIIKIAGGSKVLVGINNGATTIRTLHDGKLGSVQFIAGTSSAIHVGIGQQLLIADAASTTRSQLTTHGIAVRNTKTNALPGGLTASLSEFSLVSAIGNHPILKSMYQSSSKADRKHMEQIYKNICVLGYVTANRGPFQASK